LDLNDLAVKESSQHQVRAVQSMAKPLNASRSGKIEPRPGINQANLPALARRSEPHPPPEVRMSGENERIAADAEKS